MPNERPFMTVRIGDLENLVDQYWDDELFLEGMLGELVHRKTPKAAILKISVTKRLDKLKTQTNATSDSSIEEHDALSAETITESDIGSNEKSDYINTAAQETGIVEEVESDIWVNPRAKFPLGIVGS